MNPLRWVSFWSTGELGIRDYNLTILVWRRSILYFFDCHTFLKVKQRLRMQPLFLCWHRAIFPVRRQTSIVATDELNFRVRNGNGWTLVVIDTNFGDPCGNRTHVWGVRGPRLNLLTNGPSSKSASFPSFPPLAFGCRRKLRIIPLFLLSESNPLRWASIRCRGYGLSAWYTIRDSNPGHPD